MRLQISHRERSQRRRLRQRTSHKSSLCTLCKFCCGLTIDQRGPSDRLWVQTSLWTLVFGTLIAVGTLKRLKFINTGFTHLVYLVITLAFWIAVGASLQVTLSNGTYQHRTTIRACEWFGWLEAIFTVIAIPWCLFGVAHAQEGIRGSVAV